ncbi:hypothetical protein NKOR_09845 [Candidatus Nitrosopumilus koreensis AR1]|uniref:Uncharacterized protein n=1 Tax=Candidatus Nitrosopumilus koreensis AR1 TaxID=1229908 RepID=K0B8I0_9ARCH|nr:MULTISPECIES: hypothetical protein [Nitrosopumilus]AFS81814.1 hypothetical protein NKOR_09845 [Candidatus Nitrosopumilus koreensis AR1]
MKTQQAAMFAVVAVAAAVGGIFSAYPTTENSEMYSESSNIMGHITLTVADVDGNIVDYVQTDNLVVDVGIDTMGDLIFPNINLNGNATDSQFSWIGIGTNNTAANASDVGIGTAISGCARVQDGTVTGDSSVSGEITVTVDASFSGANCAGAVVEAVLMNDGSSGELLARQVFSAVNVGASDTLTVSWDITLT